MNGDFAAKFWYPVGVQDEPWGQNGVRYVAFSSMVHPYEEHARNASRAGLWWDPLNIQSELTALDLVGDSNNIEAAIAVYANMFSRHRRDERVIRETIDASIESAEYFSRRSRFSLDAVLYEGEPASRRSFGTADDMKTLSVDDVLRFRDTHLNVSNATLTLIGKFDWDETKHLVKKYFGGFPKSPPRPEPQRNHPEPDGPVERSVIDSSDQEAHRLIYAWETPGAGNADDEALNMLEHAFDVTCAEELTEFIGEQGSLDRSGWRVRWGPSYFVIICVFDDMPSYETQGVIDEIVEDWLDTPIDEETLDKARKHLESTAFPYMLTGPYHSSWTHAAPLRMLHDARDLNHVRKFYTMYNLDASELNDVRDRHFTPKNFSRITVVPQSEFAASISAHAEEGIYVPLHEPVVAELPDFRLETLPNGLCVAYWPEERGPVAYFGAYTKLEYAKRDEWGIPVILDQVMTAQTENYDREELLAFAKRTSGEGIYGSESAVDELVRTRYNFLVTSAYTHSDDVLETVSVVADCLQRTAFDEDHVAHARDGLVASSQARESNASLLAYDALRFAFFDPGCSPRLSPTPEAAQHIQHHNVREYYEQHVRPNNTVIVVSGQFDQDEISQAIHEHFGDWKAHSSTVVKADRVNERIAEAEIVLLDAPQATDVRLFWAKRAPDRDSPDYGNARMIQFLLNGNGPEGNRVSPPMAEKRFGEDSVRSQLAECDRSSMQLLETSITADNFESVLQGWRDALTSLGETSVDVHEWDRGRFEVLRYQRLMNGLYSTRGLVCYRIADHLLSDIDRFEPIRFHERVWTSDVEALRSYAEDFLEPDTGVFFLVGNIEAFRDMVERNFDSIVEIDSGLNLVPNK